MLGKLKKVEDLGWMVDIEDKDYMLHPDDCESLDDLMKIFDNLEARITQYPEGDFEIVEHQKMDGIIKYAKLLDNV